MFILIFLLPSESKPRESALSKKAITDTMCLIFLFLHFCVTAIFTNINKYTRKKEKKRESKEESAFII